MDGLIQSNAVLWLLILIGIMALETLVVVIVVQTFCSVLQQYLASASISGVGDWSLLTLCRQAADLALRLTHKGSTLARAHCVISDF